MGMVVPRAVETDAQNITVTIPLHAAQEVALVLWSACQEFAENGAHPDEYAELTEVTNALVTATTEAAR